MISDLIVIARSKSDDHHKTPIRSTDTRSRPLIAIINSIWRSTSNSDFIKRVLRDVKNRPRSNLKFSMFMNSFRVPFVSACSQLNSASIECIYFNFYWKTREKSSLELQTSSSEFRNEKPWIRRLIGSFRRLIWVRLVDFILIFHHLTLIFI